MPRLMLDKDVKPLSEFRANAASCLRQVQKSKRPVVITHRGKSAAVLLDVVEYEGLLQRIEVLEDIRLAESQIAAGKGISHEAALARVLKHISP
jgi:prevent-host-death family protein